MDGSNLLERAYDLAQSGKCRNTKDIRDALRAEGFNQLDIGAHLHGLALTRALNALCRAACPTDDGAA